MASGQGIWDTGSTQSHEVGTRAALSDGRVYYYARNSGVAIVAGNLLMSEVLLAGFEDLVIGAETIGTTEISYTSGSGTASANDFAGGYMVVIDDTGEGITYKIASHAAIAATTASTLTLKDPICVATAAGTTVMLMKNPWADVVIAASGQTHFPCGVSNVAVAAGSTTKQFFWCQTWGVAAVWQDEASAIGSLLTSGTTAGQCEAQDAVAECIIGTELYTGTIDEYQPVFLQIAP